MAAADLNRIEIPYEVIHVITGSDGHGDYEGLYKATKNANPNLIVELGTRGAVSTRVLKIAAPNARIVTIDTDAECGKYVPTGVEFIHDDAANVVKNWTEPIDVLFVDTDPHSMAQTFEWCKLWLPFTKIALFHDSIKSGVGDGLNVWLSQNPDWVGRELGIHNGMFMLTRALHSGVHPPTSARVIPAKGGGL